MVSTYRARRRIKMAAEAWREPGELIPEAAAWRRNENFVHTGYIVATQVEEAEFRAALAQFCPEQTQWLIELAGLDPDVSLHGPMGTPRRIRPKPVLVALEEHTEAPAPRRKRSHAKSPAPAPEDHTEAD